MSNTSPQDLRPLLTRLDAIIRELEALRRQLIMEPEKVFNLAEKLFGVLGNGSWDEYDPDLDWKRFGS
jgi:hypothetical protein